MSTARNDFRNLVYKLCKGREVPLLVTDIIAGCLVHRDLIKINILSRSLSEQVNAIIYRDLVVDLDGSEQCIKTASLLFRTLLTSKSAARAVRTLFLAGDPLQDWRYKIFLANKDSESNEGPLRGRTPPGMNADLSNFTQRETELYDKVAHLSSANKRPSTSEVPVWALYLHLIRLTPHVQGFSVRSDYFRFPDFRSTLQDVARDSSLRELRSCILCLDLLQRNHQHVSAIQDWDDALLALFTAPDIQSIAAVVSLKPEAVRQLRPGGSSITQLDLHHYQIQLSDLSSLLAATPSLRHLKYHARTDHSWLTYEPRRKEATSDSKHRIGLEPLFNALHHVSDSLQELHVSQNFDEDSIHFCEDYAIGHEPIFRQKEELSSLERLHTLTIPYVTLLGCKNNDYFRDWNVILPSSLRRIFLTDNFHYHCRMACWTDQDLMPIISGLVERLSATQRENEAAEFGLHLTELRCEFNEPVRQELARICEEHGVRCSIEKVHADRQRTPPRPHVPRGRGLGRGRRTGRGRGNPHSTVGV